MTKVALSMVLGLLTLGASSPDDPPVMPRSLPPAVKKTKPSQAPVVTNADLPSRESGAGKVSVATPAHPEAAQEAAKVVGRVGEDETAPSHDEAYWRDRMNKAQAKIASLEKDLDWAQKRVLMLRMDMVVAVDPTREFNRRTEVENTMQEQSRIEMELAKARLEPAAIREEGRREGALPGWFR